MLSISNSLHQIQICRTDFQILTVEHRAESQKGILIEFTAQSVCEGIMLAPNSSATIVHQLAQRG